MDISTGIFGVRIIRESRFDEWIYSPWQLQEVPVQKRKNAIYLHSSLNTTRSEKFYIVCQHNVENFLFPISNHHIGSLGMSRPH